MAEKPDETSGSAEIGPAPWPVVGRSMINYDAPAAPAQASSRPSAVAPDQATRQSPAPVDSAPDEHVRAGARWTPVALALTGMVLLVAATAVLVVLVVLPWFS